MAPIINGGKFKLFFVIGLFTFGAQTTSGLVTCDTTASDANFAQCVKNMVLDLSTTWRLGLPTLGIPPMDPCTFPGFSVDGGSVAVSFQASLSNITFTGINQMTTVDFVFNTTAHTIGFTATFPLTRAAGQYTATGDLLPILPLSQLTHISGNGAFLFQFEGSQIDVSCYMKNETDGTNTFVAVYDCVVGLTIVDYSIQFDNIGGNSVTALAINSLLNAGRTTIFQQLKPEFELELREVIYLIINPFLETQPYLSAVLKP